MLANHPNVLGGGGVATNIIGGTGLFADGTVAAPSISFLADQDTGIYRIGPNNIGITLAGQQMLNISTVGLKIENTLSVAGGSTPSNEEMITIGNHFDPTTIAKFYAVGAPGTYKYIQGGWNVDTYGNGRSGYMIKGVSGFCGYTGDSRTEITCGTNDTIYFGGLSANGFLNLSPTLTAFGQINNTGLTVAGAVAVSSSTSATSSAGAIVATGGVSAKNLFLTATSATYDNTNPSIAFSSAGGALGFYSQSNTLYFASTAQRILGFTNSGLSFSINGDATSPNIATDAANASGFFAPANGSIAYSGGGTERFRIAATTGAATFTGAVAVGNTVGGAVSVASTHKVTMVIGGVTYYLLATNVP